MRRIVKGAATVLKWGTLGSTLGFVACVLIQIYARLLLETAPSWTEEAARLFFVLSIGFAAGLALRSDYYVYFDFFYARMRPGGQRVLNWLIDGLTTALFLLFLYHALRFSWMGLAERSPSLKFPMAIAFVSMVILSLSVLIFVLERLLKRWTAETTRP
jgi:TRAP-type C4-dicarboxylate transport system permease small subunit